MPPESSPHEPHDNAPLIAQALSDQGEAALIAGDLPTAAATLQEAVALWRTVNEPASLAHALSNLGVTYARMNEPRKAIPLLTEAAALLNEASDPAAQATALNALGAAYLGLGDHSQALTHLRAALALHRQAAGGPGELLTLDLLAHASSAAGEKLAALAYRREHLQAARATGDRAAEAQSLVALSEALSATGYDAEATPTLEEAAAIYEQLGSLREAGETLLKLAQLHLDAGNIPATIPPVEKALPMLRQAGAWDLRATQWESFLFSQRMQQQLSGAFGQWRRGEPGGIDSILEAVRERLNTRGPGPVSPLNEQLLETLANAASRLAAISPSQPQPKQPSTDDLAAQDTRPTPDIIAALLSPDAPERRKAALALGVRGDLTAVEPLIAACEDRNNWVRMAAARSLGKLKDPRALDALRKRVEEDRDKEVRRSAATALGALGDKRAVPSLTIALTDNYYRTVESAEKALRKLKTAPDFPTFLALLTHKDVVRRYAAANRLALLGDPRAVDPLAREAENSTQPIEARVAMLKALAALKDPRGLEAALRVLAATPDEPDDPTKGLTPNAQLKQAALNLIAATGDPSGLPPLTLTPTLLPYLTDPSPYVRRAAAKALGAVGNETAIPALEHLQQFDDDTIHIPLPSETGVQRERLRSAAAEAITRIRARLGH
ncbi:MAG: HEAT repeat domain-containing protein [Chloroflexia bacterium]